ncbi:IS5 family transposase [Sphingomonas sp. Ag1]|uniref:IS5 family transposase n=1 Tax=Sphingomonas sp. Ag1 TaxID=1642949 RepID=UPI001E4E7E96|nr:IS5 family transposase [Sphingomonas sp. Ag1]
MDDRRVISGILYVLKVGCCWCDCPADYGPSTTVYNRFNRWSHRGFWLKLLNALVDADAVTRSTAIDSTYVKAQRAAFGAKRGGGTSTRWLDDQGPRARDVVGRPYALMLTAGIVSDIKAAPALLQRAGRMRYLLADKGYDANQLRRSLRDAGPSRSSLAEVTASGSLATTRGTTAVATWSRMPSAASGTSVGSPHATTSPPPTSSRALPPQRLSPSGCE